MRKTVAHLAAFSMCLVVCGGFPAQSRAQSVDSVPQPAAAAVAEPSGTSTDLFVGIGSDFDRPGLLARANYGVGIGHTFGFLKKDPIGDELTLGYSYENAGTHGFLHTDFGEHTESAGVMKNFGLPKIELISGYTWIQGGITSYTGNAHVRTASTVALRSAQSFISAITVRSGYRRPTTRW